MADTPNFAEMTDAELDAFIKGSDVSKAPPGAGAQVASQRAAATQALANKLTPPPTAEEIEPSAWKRGAAAFSGA